MPQKENFIKAWFDTEAKGYRFYLPNGQEILFTQDCQIHLDDNWGNDFQRATINMLVSIVNEKPELKTKENAYA